MIYVILVLYVSFTIFVYHKVFIRNTLIYNSMKNSLFSILVVLISIKIQFKNDFLMMSIVYIKGMFKKNNFIQISFEFSSIFFIAALFDKYTFFIDKYLKRNASEYKIKENTFQEKKSLLCL